MANKEMTGEERILRALQLKEADRVPHFEWYIDKKKSKYKWGKGLLFLR